MNCISSERGLQYLHQLFNIGFFSATSIAWRHVSHKAVSVSSRKGLPTTNHVYNDYCSAFCAIPKAISNILLALPIRS